jgi:hypothetical protein
MTEAERNKKRRCDREKYEKLTKEQKAEKNKKITEWHNENLAAWKPVIKAIYGITDNFNCQVCRKKLNFLKLGNGYKGNDVICFDHKKDNIAIKKSPSSWLSSHSPTPKNIEFFKSCNFGILCHNCNIQLGSPENRKKRLLQQIRYVYDNLPNTEEEKIKNILIDY